MTDDNKESNRPFIAQYEGTESQFNEISQTLPHEVFRNNTTSVEVIVKEVTGKRKKMADPSYANTDITVRRLYKDIEVLKQKLFEAKAITDEMRETSRTITFEIKKQLDSAHQRELKAQAKNLATQLENLKLRALLESKTNLVKKLKKELMNVKRVVKFVAKGVGSVCQTPEFTINSESEYTAFEKELQNGFISNILEADGFFTFDST